MKTQGHKGVHLKMEVELAKLPYTKVYLLLLGTGKKRKEPSVEGF